MKKTLRVSLYILNILVVFSAIAVLLYFLVFLKWKENIYNEARNNVYDKAQGETLQALVQYIRQHKELKIGDIILMEKK